MHFSSCQLRFFADIRNGAHHRWLREDAENPRILWVSSFPDVIRVSAALQITVYEGFDYRFSFCTVVKWLKIVTTIVEEDSYDPGFVDFSYFGSLLKINQENGAILLNEDVIRFSIA